MKQFLGILAVQLITTWILAGFALFNQFIHYPLYDKIREGFVDYERSHIRRAAFLLGPFMIVELVTAIILVGVTQSEYQMRLSIVNLLLVIAVWLFTLLLSIQQHQKLSIRFSKKLLHSLLFANYLRLSFWLAKGGVLIAMLF